MARPLFISAVLAMSLISLSACETAERVFSNDSPQLVAPPDNVSAMLADAADRASNALETLAAIEHSRTPQTNLAPITGAPPELRRAITVNWVGPAEKITKTLADRASYQFIQLGNPPPVPIIVSIDAENRPIVDVIRDIGLQLGNRGNIKVDAQNRVVELSFPPTSEPAGG